MPMSARDESERNAPGAGPAREWSPRISVIVPVLDEEARIGRQLERLASLEGLHEIIVVDGGSRDGTVERVEATGTRLLVAARGRATQMNAGAAAGTGDVLLFLHADVELPTDTSRRVADALRDPRVVAGAFRTWTVPDGTRRAWLGPLLHLADLRSRYARVPYGDQAIFVRADAFRAVGGFPEQPLMEDIEIGRRLRRIGRVRTVRSSVRVSGRRFQAHPLTSFIMMNVFPLLYGLGVAPRTLARLYGDAR
jgi:rSAM/selenodomain-associated transferase 2